MQSNPRQRVLRASLVLSTQVSGPPNHAYQPGYGFNHSDHLQLPSAQHAYLPSVVKGLSK
jgi:hypothetical protein